MSAIPQTPQSPTLFASLLHSSPAVCFAASLIPIRIHYAPLRIHADTAKTRLMNQRQRLAALQAASASVASTAASAASSAAASGVHMGGTSLAAAAAQAATAGASLGQTSAFAAARGLHAAAASSKVVIDAASTMAGASAAVGRAPSPAQAVLYTSTFDCLRRTWATEGMRGLYAGFSQQWLRLGPHTVITFLAYEKLRSLAGVRPV